MVLADYVAIAAILIVLGLALAYIIKEKKSGKRCIGCPYADACAKNQKGDSGCCSCGNHEEEDK